MSGFSKFKEKASAGGGKYLKPGDIKDTQEFRIIPWIFKKTITPILFYYEGWIAPKGPKDNSKPIRFEFNEDGEYSCDEDIEWADGKFGIQKPQASLVCIIADYETESVRVLSGNQKGIMLPFMDFYDPESKKYIKDWSAYKILITNTKKEKKSNFTVEREKLDPEDRAYPKWLNDALRDFDFSLDDYMRCEKTEEGEGDTYKDVLDLIGDKPSRQTEERKTKKNTDDQERSPSDSFEVVADWAKVVTPNGVVLGKATEEKLKDMKSVLDGKAKYDKSQLLYRAICSGILAHAKEEGEPDFESEMSEEDIPF